MRAKASPGDIVARNDRATNQRYVITFHRTESQPASRHVYYPVSRKDAKPQRSTAAYLAPSRLCIFAFQPITSEPRTYQIQMNGTKRPEMDGTKRPEMDGTKRPRRWDANASTNSIRVLGAKASCPCVAIDDLPLTLGPNEMKPIRVRLVAGSVAGVQRESAVLLFDDSTPRITLGVTAFVHPNP